MQMPESVILREDSTPDHGFYVLQPLEEGFGVTIGNSLRRILLSSIPGAAIIAVQIHGVHHEFQTIPGVSEDMAEIVLNFKGVRLKLLDKRANRITLKIKGPGVFTARDIQTATDVVEVMNPDHHIATLSHDTELSIELVVGRGKGYVPAEENRNPEYPLGMIPIDAIFTPIKNVNYTVEPFRVGQKTDYERLTLDVLTDGTITAEEAIQHAARIMRDHIQLFISFEPMEQGESEDSPNAVEHGRVRKILITRVDELELSVRSHNCLRAANIRTIADLVRRQEQDLLKFRNFGRKSLAELTEIVQNFGLTFGIDVDKYLSEEDKKYIHDLQIAGLADAESMANEPFDDDN